VRNDALAHTCAVLKQTAAAFPFTEAQEKILTEALRKFDTDALFAVRSSSPHEDLEGASFAGGYETVLMAPLTRSRAGPGRVWQALHQQPGPCDPALSMCHLAPSIARRSMAARSRATPTIQSCGRSRPTPAMPTRRGLGDEGECDASVRGKVRRACRNESASDRGSLRSTQNPV